MHLQELLKRKRWAAAITGFFFIILYWLSFFQIFMDQNVLLIHDRSCCEQLKAENRIKISQLEPELHSWVYALGRREQCGVAILCARPHPPYTPNIFLNEFRRLKKMTLGAPKNTEIRENTEKSHACWFVIKPARCRYDFRVRVGSLGRLKIVSLQNNRIRTK